MSGAPAGAVPGRILVGTQGFTYPEWTGLVYPPGLPAGRRLAVYARQFGVVELDTTYYAAPRPALVARWADAMPPGFVVTAKVPKAITLEARLAGDEALRQVAEFLETMRLLGDRLGPLVFQMSPNFRFPRDFAALETALRQLPALGGAGLRFAVEFRHPSWWTSDAPAALLQEQGVAWVWNDWEPARASPALVPRAIDEPAALKTTSDAFAYVRLTGNHDAAIDYRTVVIDRGADLRRWANLARAFRRGRASRDVYVLLNNHYSGSSARTVRELERVLGLPVRPFGGAAWQEPPPAGGTHQLPLL